MIQIILLLFAIVLLLIGWYFRKHASDLEVVFTAKNRKNIQYMAISFIISGFIGLLIGFFFPTKLIALYFISIVLVISTIFSVQLSRFMK